MDNIKEKISEKGLKITPQRIIILEAIYNIGHPTADEIIKHIRKEYSNIAVGTVYKVLDTFVQKGIIKKITTEKDVIRYDGNLIHHHHLHGSEDILIKDYVDEELDKILNEYFKKKKIKDFNIEDVTLHIKGKFN